MNIQNQVLQEYNKATEVLRTLCTIRYGGNAEAKFQKFLQQFDEILQGVLLYAALEDHSLCAEEQQILELVHSRGNVLHRINAQAKYENPDWQDVSLRDLETISSAQHDKLNRLIPSALAMAINDFIAAFSEVDLAIASKDYLAEIKEQIMRISALLAVADGDMVEDRRAQQEFSSSISAFTRLIEEYWRPADTGKYEFD